MHIKKFYIPNSILIAFTILVGLNFALFYISPEDVVAYIGVSNTYWAAFLIAAFGGLSSITSGVLYSAIATFASGGAIPWLLGIFAGVGIAIGDSLVFALISYGVQDVSPRWQDRVLTIKNFINQYPSWVIFLVLFFILGISPLPNDIVIFAMVLVGFRYWTVAPLLLLSGISIATLTAYVGGSAFQVLFG